MTAIQADDPQLLLESLPIVVLQQHVRRSGPEHLTQEVVTANAPVDSPARIPPHAVPGGRV